MNFHHYKTPAQQQAPKKPAAAGAQIPDKAKEMQTRCQHPSGWKDRETQHHLPWTGAQGKPNLQETWLQQHWVFCPLSKD